MSQPMRSSVAVLHDLFIGLLLNATIPRIVQPVEKRTVSVSLA